MFDENNEQDQIDFVAGKNPDDAPIAVEKVTVKERPQRALILSKIEDLARDNPDKFLVRVRSNDHQGSLTTITTICVGGVDYDLRLGVVKKKDGSNHKQEILLSTGDDDIYRLDITYGDEALENYQRFLVLTKMMSDGDLSSNSLLDDRFELSEGGLFCVEYVDSFNETKISAEDMMLLLSDVDFELVLPALLAGDITLQRYNKISGDVVSNSKMIE